MVMDRPHLQSAITANSSNDCAVDWLVSEEVVGQRIASRQVVWQEIAE